MRLRLTCWAEDLRRKADAFAVLTVLKRNESKPTVLGKTEVVSNTRAPDFTKSFLVDDYELGEEQTVIVSLYNGKTAIGTALFEIGTVIAVGAMAKELKDRAGVVAIRVEEVNNEAAGQLNVQLRGCKLKNMDAGPMGLGILNKKSDPFFEILRARKHAKTGATVWDAVYRSKVIENNLNPIWPEAFIDLDVLGPPGEKFQILVYDEDKSGRHDMIGSVAVTVQDLLDNVNDTALQETSKIDKSRSFTLKNGREETGKLLVVKAGVPAELRTSALAPAEAAPPDAVNKERAVEAEEPDIDTSIQPITRATSSDELEVNACDIPASIQPTFVNYVAGGCELRVIAAIDTTASNGDPRQDTSLHHFKDDGRNEYEEAMFAICSILAKYDTDQKYPVFGFGAKRDGQVSHCFPFGNQGEVDGVDGILKVYRETFRSGIVMSNPRDFSEVIQEAGKDAKKALEKGQAYSILLIFTNGGPNNTYAKSAAALKEVDDAPLSIVIVGLGKGGDFQNSKKLAEPVEGSRDKVRFVRYLKDKDHDNLAKDALHDIPSQLEQYFITRDIFPDPESECDEISVEPYDDAAEDIVVPLVIDDAGDITVTSEMEPPPKLPAKVPPKKPNKISNGGKKVKNNLTMKQINQGMREARKAMRQVKQAKRMFNQVGKLFN